MTSSTAASSTLPKPEDLAIRRLVDADIPAIEAILQANRPLFSDAECRVAVAMVREGLAASDDDPYQFLVVARAGRCIGYACFGTIPLTEGGYDLYWIVVHPESQSRGVGRLLLRHCEGEIAGRGGRLVVIETSSRSDYDKSRRFYETTMAYERVGQIKDFYRPGDDKITYVKRLSTAGRSDS